MAKRILQRVLRKDLEEYKDTMSLFNINYVDIINYDEEFVYIVFECTSKNMGFIMFNSPFDTFIREKIRITTLNGLDKYRVFKHKSCIYFENFYENVYELVLLRQGLFDFAVFCHELTEKGLIQIDYLD